MAVALRSFVSPVPAVPAEPFVYDSNGNLTADANFAYAYDWANRLTKATAKQGSLTWEYSWDPLGRRVKETRTDSSGTGTTFVTHAGDTAVSLSSRPA